MKTSTAVQTFLRSRQAENLAPGSISCYRGQLLPFARSYEELPTRPEEVEDYVAAAPGGTYARRNRYSAIRTLYNFLERRYGAPNPVRQVPPPRLEHKLRPTLTAQEMMRLLLAASSLRDRAILTLLLDTGIRSGELAGLRRWDLTEGSIHVRGKSGERQVPISEETGRILRALDAQNDHTDHIFVGQHGPITRHAVYRIVRGYMRRAGIPGPKQGGHRLRHGFALGFLMAGGDMRSLQGILGHADIKTTQTYTSMCGTDLADKHRQFSPLRHVWAAAQGQLWDKGQVVTEAEEILQGEKDGSDRADG